MDETTDSSTLSLPRCYSAASVWHVPASLGKTPRPLARTGAPPANYRPNPISESTLLCYFHVKGRQSDLLMPGVLQIAGHRQMPDLQCALNFQNARNRSPSSASLLRYTRRYTRNNTVEHRCLIRYPRTHFLCQIDDILRYPLLVFACLSQYRQCGHRYKG